MKFLFAFIFLISGITTNAQSITSLQPKTNLLTVHVVDVVDHVMLKDYTLTLKHESDSVSTSVDFKSHQVFEIKESGTYQLSITKEGYRSLEVEWEQPEDRANVIVDFFVPKDSLSKSDLKYARAGSRRVPNHYPIMSQGGFQRVGPSRKQMCLSVVTINEKSSSAGSYVFE